MLLIDRDTAARQFAVMQLSKLPVTEAHCNAVKHALQGDMETSVRAATALALARMQGEAAIPVLEAALSTDPSESVRHTLRNALAVAGHQQ